MGTGSDRATCRVLSKSWDLRWDDPLPDTYFVHHEIEVMDILPDLVIERVAPRSYEA